MNPKLVLFDLDGTLVDSMGIYARKAAQLISEHYGVPESEARELYLKTSGLPFIKQLEILFPGDKKNKQVAEIFESWKKYVVKNLRIDPEGVEVIRHLSQRGILTAISSNNLQEYAEEIVRLSGAEPNYILGWDGRDFTKGRPHIEYLERETGIGRSNFLMVGDSPNDLKLAKDSGVNFIALLKEFPEEAFLSIDKDVRTIKNLREILDIKAWST